jgi:MFS family permease
MDAGSPWSPRVSGFLLAEAISAIGSFATVVAIWSYAAYEYDASPTDIALFGVAFTVPGVLLGPVSGAVIDRLGPKATLGFAKVVGFVASLALLAATDFRQLALLSALHGAVYTFTTPALQSLPPRLVDDRHLARTNALVSLTDELSLVLGPVAGGVAIGVFGFKGAFVFDALTYLLGLLVLPIVRLRPRQDADADEPRVRIRDVLDGWRVVWGTRVLRRVVGCTMAVYLLYGASLLAEPLYVRDTLERSVSVFASLQSVFGVFLVTGGIIAARMGDRWATFGFVALGVGGSGLTAIVYLGTPSVVVAFVGVALWGVFTAAISGPSRTVIQRATPERAHGRVLSTDFVAANVAQLVGIAVAGPLIQMLGVPWSILGLGLAVSTVALVLFQRDRADRRLLPERSDGGDRLPGVVARTGEG